MARPKRTEQPPVRQVESEDDDKFEVVRRQVLDALDSDGLCLIYDFHQRRVRRVDAMTAFRLLRLGQASLQDPPGRRRDWRKLMSVEGRRARKHVYRDEAGID